MYIKSKINRFNEIFTTEEKMVIILGSIVTIMTIIIVWILVLNMLLELTAPILIKAINTLINAIFPGWTL